jgi:hypothetical protein
MSKQFIAIGLECPQCKCMSVPMSMGGNATACQNLECRIVVDKTNTRIGQWTEGYMKLVMDKADSQVNRRVRGA